MTLVTDRTVLTQDADQLSMQLGSHGYLTTQSAETRSVATGLAFLKWLNIRNSRCAGAH